MAIKKLNMEADNENDTPTGSNCKILVLGASGTTGVEVAKQLVALDIRPRLLVRSRSRAKVKSFEGEAEIFKGDLFNESDLNQALEDIKKVYLVSAGIGGPDLEIKVIDAAKKAGVEHIVKLSVMTADKPELTYAKWHANTERHLKDSGIAWTILRSGNFSSNVLSMWADTIKSRSAFYQPTGNGKWACVDPIDIAAVAVKALTEFGHEGKAYILTGPESTNAGGYAAMIAETLGRPVNFIDITSDVARDSMASFGMPEDYLNAAIELMDAMRNGEWDFVSRDIEIVLGRPPIRFQDWLHQNKSALL